MIAMQQFKNKNIAINAHTIQYTPLFLVYIDDHIL